MKLHTFSSSQFGVNPDKNGSDSYKFALRGLVPIATSLSDRLLQSLPKGIEN